MDHKVTWDYVSNISSSLNFLILIFTLINGVFLKFKPWLLLEDYDFSSSFSLSSGHGFSSRIMILTHFQVMRKCSMPCRNKLPCFLHSLSPFAIFYAFTSLASLQFLQHTFLVVYLFLSTLGIYSLHMRWKRGPIN
jgi:hypothetical protein